MFLCPFIHRESEKFLTGTSRWQCLSTNVEEYVYGESILFFFCENRKKWLSNGMQRLSRQLGGTWCIVKHNVNVENYRLSACPILIKDRFMLGHVKVIHTFCAGATDWRKSKPVWIYSIWWQLRGRNVRRVWLILVWHEGIKLSYYMLDFPSELNNYQRHMIFYGCIAPQVSFTL